MMKAFLNWSGGKDSAFCLYKTKEQGLQIDALVTSVNQKHNRISMHGVKQILLEQQAASIQLPLYIIEMPEQTGMKTYEEKISATNRLLKQKGFSKSVFGDIFLEDLKKYRQQLYAKDEMECLFPLWQMGTKELMKEFIAVGFKAIVVCTNNNLLPECFCGRLIDESFINDLPLNVDPCGENGEYHSFVFDGPLFQHPVLFQKGEIVYEEYPSPKSNDDCFTTPQATSGFYFCDLLAI